MHDPVTKQLQQWLHELSRSQYGKGEAESKNRKMEKLALGIIISG